MSTPKAVVIGVDDSWQRAGAVEWALDEALRSGAPIHVVHVVDDTYTKRPDETPDAALEQAHGLVRTVRGHIDRSAPRVVAVDTTTPVGRPGPMLAAEAAQARMLVVGRRGTGRFARLLVGSTSESAVSHAEVPVVVVPEGWEPAAHRGGQILVGVDTAAPSVAALEFAFETAAGRRATVRMANLWELPSVYSSRTGSGWDTEALYARWADENRERFDALVAEWRDKHPEVPVRSEQREEHPVGGLVDIAAAASAQLLVVGGRPHGRLTGMLLGSVARGVLQHASCPVAVVHDPGRTTQP